MFKKFFEKNREKIYVFLIYVFITSFFLSYIFLDFAGTIPGQPGDSIDSLHKASGTFQDIEGAFNEGFLEGGQYLLKHYRLFFDLKAYSNIFSVFLPGVVSYNVIYFLSFLFASFFAYLLLRKLNIDIGPSFLGGVVFSFAPHHFGYANGFFGAMHTGLVPIMFLVAVLFFEKFSWKRLALLLFVFILTYITESHFAYFGFYFLVIFGFYKIIDRTRSQSLDSVELRKYIVSSVFFLGGGLIAALPLLRVAFSSQNYLAVSTEELIANSLDLFNFFLPSAYSLFFGDIVAPAWATISESVVVLRGKHFSEVSGYLGVSLVVLVLVSFFIKISQKKKRDRNFWLFVSLLFFTLSLGPFLSVGGPVFPVIPLPVQALREFLPFMENIRAIGRVFVVGFMAFVVVLSIGIEGIIEKISVKYRVVALALLFLVVIIEFIQVPPMIKVEVPKVVNVLAQEDSSGRILNVNSAYCYVCANQFKYYNFLHQQKVLGGMWFGRPGPSSRFSVEQNTPFIKELLYNFSLGEEHPRTVIRHNLNAIGGWMLADNNIDYLLVETSNFKSLSDPGVLTDAYLTPKNYKTIRSAIEQNLSIQYRNNEKGMLAYKVLPPEGEKDYILLRQPRDAKNVFVKNLGTGEEHIPFSNGDVLQLENYTEDAVYVKMQLSSPGIIGSEQFILKHAGEEYVFNVTNERRWIGLVLPKTTEPVSEIEFRLPEDIEIQAHYITYESSVGFNKSKEEILSSIEEDYYSVVYYDESIGIGLPKDSLYKGLAELDAVTDGVLDFEKIDLSRDIYTDEYYALYLYSLLKENGINAVLFEKFDESFSQNYDGVLRKRFDLFDVAYENDRFILYQLKDFYDEFFQDSIDLVFLRGIDPPTLNIHGYEGLSIYRYRKIRPQFSLGSYDSLNEPHILSFNIFGANFVQELEKYSFEFVDRNGERKRKIPFNKQMDVEVEGHDFTFTLLDSEGEIVRFEEDQGMVMYNLSLKKKE